MEILNISIIYKTKKIIA